MKILIADDSATLRRLMAARLEADGYEVIEAADGEEALNLTRSNHPDLLVLDKVMPKLDGFEVVRALRGSPQTKMVPIVMLTGWTSAEDMFGGYGPGPDAGPEPGAGSGPDVDEYMPKPFSPRELSACVRRTLERTGGVPRQAPSGQA